MLYRLVYHLFQNSKNSTARRARRRRGSNYDDEENEENEHRKTSLPLVYALARSWAWEAVTFRCQTHPHEVSELFVDNLGETMLHWACLGKPPLASVLAILNICPQMAKAKNKAGHLPLHVAMTYRAPADVIRALIDAYPAGAKEPNGAGSYPIHLFCDYGPSVDSLRALLETEDGASTISFRDRATGLTPLYILSAHKNVSQWRKAIVSMRQARQRQQTIRKKIQSRIMRQQLEILQPLEYSETFASEQASESAAFSETSEIGGSTTQTELQRQERLIASFQQNDYWQKAALLVLVEYTKQPLKEGGIADNEYSIVHACAGLPHCPSSLLEFAILLHADDLINKKDYRGQLPLHVAASTHATSLATRRTNKNVDHRGSKWDRSEEILLTILAACHQAAFVKDADGCLPFAVAIKVQREQWCDNGIAWSRAGLQRLLAVNPAALETLDLDERLFPYIWANRMHATANEMFCSIQRNPNLFETRRKPDCQVTEI